MEYTIKQLAKLASITVRTLHHYDAMGLLKPAYCGENGYRYYREEQLLLLQQILFYRELGFKLNDIKVVLRTHNGEKSELLKLHKICLEKKVTRIKALIKTVDKTIAYLEGKGLMMSAKEMFQGFFGKDGRGEIYANYFQSNNLITNEDLLKAEKQIRTWDITIWVEIQNTTEAIHNSLAYSMKNKFDSGSIHVQAIIEQHYKLTQRYLPLNKDAYIGLAKLYCEKDEFRNFYNGPINPIDSKNMNEGLVNYLAEGMKIYAENVLTLTLQEPAVCSNRI